MAGCNGCFTFFLSFRTGVYKTYEGVFISRSDNEQPEPEVQRSRSIGESAARGEEKAQDQFKWFIIIDILANGDVLKYEPIMDIPLTLFMNTLSYKKTFNKIWFKIF